MRLFPPLAAVLLSTLGACNTLPASSPPVAVASLDLSRYAGRWFELAKYPNRFQTQCVCDTAVDYELLPGGVVQVRNRCRLADGSFDEAIGRAVRRGGAEAELEVRFAPAWLSWLPFVWGDYWVVDLDADYTLAAVSDPERRYLWILSRTPSIDEARYHGLLARLQEKGFDLGKLVATPQISVR